MTKDHLRKSAGNKSSGRLNIHTYKDRLNNQLMTALEGRVVGDHVVQGRVGKGAYSIVMKAVPLLHMLIADNIKSGNSRLAAQQLKGLGLDRKPDEEEDIYFQRVDKTCAELSAKFATVPLREKEAIYGYYRRFVDEKHQLADLVRAFKFLSPTVEDEETTARFMREIDLGSRMRHPNLLRVVGSGAAPIDFSKVEPLAIEPAETDDPNATVKLVEQSTAPMIPDLEMLGLDTNITLFYAIAEYIPEALVLDDPEVLNTLSIADAADIGIGALTGLHYAHTFEPEEGRTDRVLHRDIKPANILVTRHTETGKIDLVKLADLGMAKQEGSEADMTATGQIMGTPLYMAPELIETGEYSELTDMYAMGGTLYKLLTSHNFVEASTTGQVVQKIPKDHEWPWVREYNKEVSRDLERLVMMSVKKLPRRKEGEERTNGGNGEAEKQPRVRLMPVQALRMLKGLKDTDRLKHRALTAQDKKTLEDEITACGKNIRSAQAWYRWGVGKHLTLGDNYFKLAEAIWQRGLDTDSIPVEELDKRLWAHSNDIIDAYEDAIEHYELFLEKAAPTFPGRQKAEEDLEDLHCLKAYQAWWGGNRGYARRSREQKKMGRKALVGGLTGAILIAAGLFTWDKISDSMTNNAIASAYQAAETAFGADDSPEADKKALEELEKAITEAKGFLPEDDPQNKKIKALSQSIADRGYRRMSLEILAAGHEILDHEQFADARTKLLQARMEAKKMSQSDQKVEKAFTDFDYKIAYQAAQSLHGSAKSFIDNRAYPDAFKTFESIEKLLAKFWKEDSDELKADVPASLTTPVVELKSGVEDDLKRVRKLKVDDGIYTSLKTDFAEYAQDYGKLEAQLADGTFFPRAELNEIKEGLETILMKLGVPDVKTRVVNPIIDPDFDKQVAEIKSAKDATEKLAGALDKKQIEALVKEATTVETLLKQSQDYIADSAVQHLQRIKAALDTAQTMYGNITPTAQGFAEMKTRFDAITQEHERLSTARTTYDALVKQGDDASRKQLLPTYLQFGHFDQAQKTLEAITDKKGLEDYVSLFDYRTKIQDKKNWVKRLPSGMTQDVLDSYSTIAQAFAEGNASSFELATELERIAVYGELATGPAEKAIADMDTTAARIKELRDLLEKGPDEAYSKELSEKETALAEQRKVLITTATGYATTLKEVWSEKAGERPPLALCTGLTELYKKLQLDKYADALVEHMPK